jgi:rod shape determining protein RodA
MAFFQIDRRSISNFDWVLLSMMVLLGAVGIVNLYSAAVGTGLWKTQAYWFLIGLTAAAAALVVDYKRLEQLAPAIYVLSLILLLGVHVFGRRISGSRSWYDLGFAHLQPSELMKIALILMVSRIYHFYNSLKPLGLRELAWPCLVAGLPILSIAAEPDMGTALTVILLFGSMMLFAGIQRRLLIIAAISLAGLVVSYPVWKQALKEHQRNRIEIFLHPERDPRGAGYNVLQAKIAVGSGGVLGQGFMKGNQNMLRFLPAQQTDFIFGVWAEEMGFIRVVAVLLLYGLLVVRGITTAQDAKDKFGVMLAVGCSALLFWHIFINIAMVVGLFPVIGVPLPFMSYGGSNLMTFMIAVALIMNVRMRKYFF